MPGSTDEHDRSRLLEAATTGGDGRIDQMPTVALLACVVGVATDERDRRITTRERSHALELVIPAMVRAVGFEVLALPRRHEPMRQAPSRPRAVPTDIIMDEGIGAIHKQHTRERWMDTPSSAAVSEGKAQCEVCKANAGSID